MRAFVRIDREHGLIGSQRLIELPQALERRGSISARGEIIRADRERVLKARKRLLMARERGKDEAVIVEYLGRSRSALKDCADELQRFDVASLLMTDETEKMLRVELAGLRGKNSAKNSFGVGELPALLQGQRLLDPAQRPRARGRLCRHHVRRAPRRATPTSS